MFIILLLLQSRVWVMMEYKASGLFVWVGYGILFFSLYPMKPLKTKKKERTKKKKPKKVDEDEQKDGMSFSQFRELFDIGIETLSRFRKSLSIDELHMFLTWGADDPADAAISYGYAQAALASLLALLEVHVSVKEKKTNIQLDYTLDKPKIYAKVSCSLRLRQAVSLGLFAGMQAYGFYRKQKKKLKKAV